MKRILWVCLFFLFNNEIVSLITLNILLIALIVWICMEVDREREKENARNRID